jgi:hypothetical protein
VIFGIIDPDQLQWPAMLVTIIAAWFMASQSKRKREAGFVLCLLANALWIAWGWHTDTYSIVVMQCALAVLNFRGVFKNQTNQTS